MRHLPILIVGAGPVGLALAVGLARDGVAVEIIDKYPGPLEQTKSAALHARTLEHLRALGCVDRVVAEGTSIEILTLRTEHQDRLSVDFRSLPDTRYPQMIDIPQNRTEHILIDRLAELGTQVRRETTMTGFEEIAPAKGQPGVLVDLVGSDGESEQVLVDWLVGADGVHSTVREGLSLDFVGAPYADPWALADAELDWPLPRNEMTFSGDADGIFGVFPLPGERRYRIAYTQHVDGHGDPVEPDIDDAQRAMSRTGLPGQITSVDQFWTFALAHKQAIRYRVGRTFLVGDAGHVHTPFGGQGLNLGIGDVAALGWRLAAVIDGRAPAALLDSFESERFAVGKQVIGFTHLGASAMLLRDHPLHHLRDVVMDLADSIGPVGRLATRRLSQLAHTYRGTSAVSGKGVGLAGGDRLPDIELYDTGADELLRLHDLLRPEAHTLLLTGTNPQRVESTARHLAQRLDHDWPRWHDGLRIVALTPSLEATAGLAGLTDRVVVDRGRQAKSLYRARPTMLLIRPDGHVGHVGPVEPEAAARYLRTVSTRIAARRSADPSTAAAAAVGAAAVVAKASVMS